ncbi:MAG: hypothetical protein NXH85_09955 [Pseudomonadaceae bacterium]|nr:hypothetical protein [Pseudomonadaceae bacterium]
MSVTYHINTEDELTTVEATGEVCAQELCQLALNLTMDVDYDPALPTLIDLRGIAINRDDIASDDDARLHLEELAKTRQAHKACGSMAVVIDDHWNASLCADVHWLCCVASKAEMFDSYDMAIKWLYRREFQPAAAVV